MPPTDPAVAYALAALAQLRAAPASGQTISGQRATGLILPPADEDPDPAARIALFTRWLARHAPGVVEETR